MVKNKLNISDDTPFFKIHNRIIKKDSPSLIIAEIGINHLGDEDLCAEMINSAIDAGADCVKLQTADASESYHPKSKSYEIFKGSELSVESMQRLSLLAQEKNSFLFSTPGDLSSLEKIKKLNMSAIKVSSGLFLNIPIIREIAKLNLPIILSTGMANEEEIDYIVTFLKKLSVKNFSILHCVSLYPASDHTLNLSYIDKISNNYNLISGYSDHSEGYLACVAAVCMGAKIIEKHYTTDNNIKGADNSISLDTENFRRMCQEIRQVESMIYGNKSKPYFEEKELKNLRYRKIVAKRDIEIGEVIDIDNVYFMRLHENTESIDAFEWDNIVGTKASSKINKLVPITLDKLKK